MLPTLCIVRESGTSITIPLFRDRLGSLGGEATQQIVFGRTASMFAKRPLTSSLDDTRIYLQWLSEVIVEARRTADHATERELAAKYDELQRP
jgi:hypothetical protein